MRNDTAALIGTVLTNMTVPNSSITQQHKAVHVNRRQPGPCRVATTSRVAGWQLLGPYDRPSK